jgi:hypothetical protein
MPMHFRFLRALPLALCFVVACGTGAPAAGPPRVAPAPKPEPPATPRAELARLLAAIERPSDVLGALDASQRKELDALVAQIGSKDREALAKTNGPLARERPLLHLAVGGLSRDAFYELATSQRTSNELLAIRRAEGKDRLDDLVPAVRGIAERAAKRYLHDSASIENPDLESLDRITRAALTLDRHDIRRLARQMAVQLAPDDPARWVTLARSEARALDVAAANAALAHARQAKQPTRPFSARLARAERLVAAAEAIRSKAGSAGDASSRLALARAYLVLDLAADAKRALEPDRARATSNLALAGTLAIADLGGSICPSMPPFVASAPLCALAWRNDPRAAKAVELLSTAWQSGGGRDADGLAAYIGLAQVVPWMYGLMSPQSGSPEDIARSIRDRLTALRRAVAEAEKQDETFEGLGLFTDALAAGFEAAAKNDNSQLEEATRDDLSKRALALGKKSPGDRFTQGGVLAVAALLFRQQDVLGLIEQLPAANLANNELPYDVLRLWSGLAAHRADIVQSATGDVGTLVADFAPDSLERPKLLLLLAEAGALSQRTDKAYGVLERVALPLTEPSVPPEVRLRAAIDAAGARARAGKAEQAADLLERVTTSLSEVGPDARALAYVAASYLLILRARVAKGSERAEYEQKLDQLEKEPIAQKAPAGVELWRSMWKNELAYLNADERCGPVRLCHAKATQKRGTSQKQIDERLGQYAGRLLSEGALPGGTLSVSFSYSGVAGLETVVNVEPQLLAVEVPVVSK